jgi:hypothetical protein
MAALADARNVPSSVCIDAYFAACAWLSDEEQPSASLI